MVPVAPVEASLKHLEAMQLSMEASPAITTPNSAETLSEPEAHFLSAFKRVTQIESGCSCMDTEMKFASVSRKKSSIDSDSTLMPPPEMPWKPRSRPDPDRSGIATIHRFPSPPKSRNNSAESQDSIMGGETVLDEAGTLGRDDSSARDRCACCRTRGEVANLPGLWEKVEGASKDVRLGGQ